MERPELRGRETTVATRSYCVLQVKDSLFAREMERDDYKLTKWYDGSGDADVTFNIKGDLIEVNHKSQCTHR